MSTFLHALARWSVKHRRAVLAMWLLVATAAVLLGTLSGGKTHDTFTIPGTEAQHAADVLNQKVPQLSGGQTQVVFDDQGADLTGGKARTAIDVSVNNLRKVDQVGQVVDPFTSKSIAPNKRVALAVVQYDAANSDVKDSTLNDVKNALQPARAAGLQVEYTGSIYPGSNKAVSEVPELIGLIVAFGILLVTFGAFVGAGLPILNAIIGVIVTLTGVTAVASFVDVASAATTVALMLGLACGIDYGLFILSRHRSHVMDGMAIEDSIPLAVGTAGSSVVFAALTVIVALCGMSVVGIPFLTVMGLSAAAAVLIAMLISLTLLPAMLGFAGGRVVKFLTFPRRRGNAKMGRAERAARLAAEHPEETLGARWARFVVRRRVPLLIGGIIVLAVIALPTTKIQLGLPSGASKPPSDTSRKAYDLTTDNFGEGFNGPLLVVVENVSAKSAVSPITAKIAALPDVLSATPVAQQNATAVIRVIPRTGPNDSATADLVHRIRSDRTTIEGDSGTTILVGGTAASNIDVSSKLSSALPVFLAVVMGLALILLTFAFRTVLVPLKSIVGFLLSAGAAFGTQVAMFQWGWGQHLLGVSPGETVSFLPIIMLAIIFGLSSDYEVFVVSRIKEDFTNTGDARGAVIRGTTESARVVASAALIMISIFLSFLLADDPTVKAIGFSFAVGVFLDAFVVRLMLVPAFMAIVQGRIWFHTGWFERHVPNPDIEGERLVANLSGTASAGLVSSAAGASHADA